MITGGGENLHPWQIARLAVHAAHAPGDGHSLDAALGLQAGDRPLAITWQQTRPRPGSAYERCPGCPGRRCPRASE
jgi:hypothetical protein